MKAIRNALVVPVLAASALGLAACDPPQPGPNNSNSIDQALLRTFKRALPKKQNLVAQLPQSAGGAGALLGEAAEYPAIAVPHVVGVNTLIGSILDTVDAVVAVPPTLFNSESQEFVWGPFDNEDSAIEGDKALVYIKDEGEGAEFRYSFAFARLAGDDVATAVPFIYGAVNPDPENEDLGNGILLIDFEASRTFTEANGGDASEEARGRIATGFFRAENEDDEGGIVSVVLGSFRGYSDGSTETTDVDHLWGSVEGSDGNKIDFIDLDITGNVLDESDAQEDLALTLVAYNGGVGRGEALLAGGDAGTSTGEGVECWNAAVEQSFYEVTLIDDQGAETVVETQGDATGCPAPFDQPIANLNLPTLDTVDAGILEALQNAAENGIAGL